MIKLYVNNQEVDVDQQETNVTVSYSVESIELGKISGAHSKRNVKIPCTKNNLQIFENIQEVGTTVTDSIKIFDTRLEALGVPILVGKGRIDSGAVNAINSGFQGKDYKISLIGNNADWFADVGNILVRNLTWQNITISTASVKTNYNPLTSEACFILMKWQSFANETYILDNELTPAVFVWQILEKAFANKGYQFESIFKTDPFNRLIIPMGLRLDADYIQDFVNLRASNPSPSNITYTSGDYGTQLITFTDETTSPNFDTGNNYSSGIYTTPLAALYELIAELNVTLTASIGDPNQFAELILFWEVDGVSVSIYDFTNETSFNDSISLEYLNDIAENKAVALKLRYQNVTFDINLSGSIQVIAEKQIIEVGETYNLQYIIPINWYVRDIISDLTMIFNLSWETDVISKKVYAYPKDDYTVNYRANATGAATSTTFAGFFKDNDLYDLNTRKVGDAEFTIIDGYKSSHVMAYATDDDTTNKEEERRGVNIYSGGYNFPTDRFEAGVEFIYTKFFAKTIHINDVDITSGGTYGVQIPLLFGDDYNTVTDAEPNFNLAPRLLYYAGRRAGVDGYVRLYDEASSASSAFDYPAAFMVNYNDPSGIDFSLSFSDEVTNFSNVVQGVFKTYHLQQFKRIELGKQYTTFVKWDNSDITNLSFRKKGSIGSGKFIIQEIEYNPKSKSPAKTVILYDEKPNVTDLTKVTNTITLAGASPQSGTITGSGSGLVGAGGDTVNIQLSYHSFLNYNTNELILGVNSGITQVSNQNANVLVFQNGQKLLPTVQYTISGSTITIDANTHYNGSNYEIIVNGITKG